MRRTLFVLAVALLAIGSVVWPLMHSRGYS